VVEVNDTSDTTAPTKDPVCGMTVEPQHAAASAAHAGETFYFCSTTCHDAFVADPNRYVATHDRH
jgi:Cu+-exporting ATPase